MRLEDFFFWTFWGLLFPQIYADSCCGESTCYDSCPWDSACSNGQDYGCMDSIAGIFKCRDMSACTRYDDCDARAAAYRSGQLCSGFPWYNGGYPVDNIKFDSEQKWFDCKIPSNNSEYCDYWSVLEDSADEFEVGNVNCTLPSANNKYCSSWFTEKKEYKKCWLVLVQNTDDAGYTYATACCGFDGYNNEPCCQTICPASFYNANVPQIEQIHCNCTAESANREYCADWYCELDTIYDPYGNNQPIQHEWYTCTTSSASDKYCSAWTGNIDSTEEFEVATCSCQDGGAGDSYCANWICFEKGTDYWWPNLLWILFSILMGGLTFAVPIIGGWTVFVHPIFWLGHFIWAGSFIFIGIWKAGIVVLIISIQPLFVIPGLWILVYNVRLHDWNKFWYNSLHQNRVDNVGRGNAPPYENERRGRVNYYDDVQTAVVAAEGGDVELAAATLVEVSLGDLKKGYHHPAVVVVESEAQAHIDDID
eukprot:gene25826-31190_t